MKKKVKVVSLMICGDDKILLEKRKQNRRNDPGKIALPGGHVKKHETLLAACKRELREELDIGCERFTFVTRVLHHTAREEQMTHYFLCEDWEGTPRCGEAERIFWTDMDCPDCLDFEEDRQAIRKLLNRPRRQEALDLETAIRQYRHSDRKVLVRLLEELQDYLVSVDDLKRERRVPEYGESYTERTLQNVSKNNGIIYVAENKSRVVGMIIGTMPVQTKEELLEHVPFKRGVVLELFVEDGYREKGVGTMLMEKMEEHFKRNGCTVSGVDVFFPNKIAYRLYSKLGYRERDIWMTKKLENSGII
jgi:ADP-ribose pyrophosphatase YjhB (NUDIX family)/predicted GNAT family acetyltransferase